MPELKGTSYDPLRTVNWRGTLVSQYTIRDLAMQYSPLKFREALEVVFKQGLVKCAVYIADAVASRSLYHIGVIDASAVASAVMSGIELTVQCGVREFREVNLGLDELEYYRVRMAEKIQGELEQMLGRALDQHIAGITGVQRVSPNFLRESPLLLSNSLTVTERPARKFEIVQRGKLGAV